MQCVAQTTSAVSSRLSAQTLSALLSLRKSVLSLGVLMASSGMRLTSPVVDAIPVARLAWVLLLINVSVAQTMLILATAKQLRLKEHV